MNYLFCLCIVLVKNKRTGPCHSFSIASPKGNCPGNFPSLLPLPFLRSVGECREAAITVSLSITGIPCLLHFTNVHHPNTAVFVLLRYNSNQESLNTKLINWIHQINSTTFSQVLVTKSYEVAGNIFLLGVFR